MNEDDMRYFVRGLGYDIKIPKDLKKMIFRRKPRHDERSNLTREQYVSLSERLYQEDLYIIQLYFFDKRKLPEIARMTKRSEKRVYLIVNHALDYLEEQLREQIRQ